MSPAPRRIAFAAALAAASAVLFAPAAAAQQPLAKSGYPERDILSPFRACDQIVGPPDAVYAQLRILRARAEDPATKKKLVKGVEHVDDPVWRAAHAEVKRLGIDAGHLAQVMRGSRNADERDLAFYGAFLVDDVAYVVNLISHIPGEPVRSIREHALRRAVDYLREHVHVRWGDLTEEQRKGITIPEPGSPAARSAGVTRKPVDADHLYSPRLIPFFQLLDVDDPVDQAQALWFLKELFAMRPDLALIWLEPALPRVEQLYVDGGPVVRPEAAGVLQTIGPKDLPPPPLGGELADRLAWAKLAKSALFPPIRSLNDAVVQMHPSPERDAIAAAGREALEGASIGDPFTGKAKDGTMLRGFRVAHVPEALVPLRIPQGAVITAVNGAVVRDGKELLAEIRRQLATLRTPKKILVEYFVGGEPRAVEYRLL